MAKSECEWCGDEFTYYPSSSSGRFCSQGCYHKFKDSDNNPNKKRFECTECGKTYYKLQSNINDGKQFCSRGCLYSYRREGGINNGECPKCGEVFDTQSDLAAHHRELHFNGEAPTDRHCPTCGIEFDDFRAVTIHHYSVHDESIKPVAERVCQHCGDSFEVDEKDLKHHDHDYCSRECAYASRRRSWGIERIRRILTPDGENWEDIAFEVREEAGGVCEMCGEEVPSHGRPGLQVHHLLPLRSGGTHADWNLIALCPSCHGRAETSANELFDRHLWGENPCMTNRTRDGLGRFQPMT